MLADDRWFTRVGYTEYGPLSGESLLAAVQSDRMMGDILVRRGPGERWRNVRDDPRFRQPEAAWYARSGRLSATDFKIPGWDRSTADDGEAGLSLAFKPRRPWLGGLLGARISALITVHIYRPEGPIPIPTGHDSLEVLAAFLSALVAMYPPYSPPGHGRLVHVGRLDRAPLGHPPGASWVQRALCRRSYQSDSQNIEHLHWLVLSAARNHLVKVLITFDVGSRRTWKAIEQFSVRLGAILSPRGRRDGIRSQGMAPAEAEQLAIHQEICARGAQGDRRLFMTRFLEQAEALLHQPELEFQTVIDFGIRLTQFAHCQLLANNLEEGRQACGFAVGLFREVTSQLGGQTVSYLHTALGLLAEFASAEGAADAHASIQRELGQLAAALGPSSSLN
jgi:hypothetical protein